jgi:hypothetical protein
VGTLASCRVRYFRSNQPPFSKLRRTVHYRVEYTSSPYRLADVAWRATLTLWQCAYSANRIAVAKLGSPLSRARPRPIAKGEPEQGRELVILTSQINYPGSQRRLFDRCRKPPQCRTTKVGTADTCPRSKHLSPSPPPRATRRQRDQLLLACNVPDSARLSNVRIVRRIANAI